MARVLGVDLGTRRIGIAISDKDGTVATPYAVLHRSSDEQDALAIAEMAGGEGIKTIVLGNPLTLTGDSDLASQVSQAFATKLREAGMRVRLWDERLTTAEADKRLKEGGMSGRKRRQVVDKVAAALLLQSFLDSK